MFTVFIKCILPSFLLLISFNHAEVINYGIYYNSVPPQRNLVQDNVKIVTETLTILDSKAVGNTSFSFQDGIEYLLIYGALLRNEITNNFGQLIYNHYQELSVSEIEALQKIHLQILERKYNIFNLLPEIFKHGDLSPASICRYMQSHIFMCLKKYSVICMNIAIGSNDFHDNISNTTGFGIARKIHQSLRGSRSNSNRFSATMVMKYLKIDEIKATSGLFLGLLLNVQYDNLDHNIQTAERHVLQDLFLQFTSEVKRDPKKGFKKYDSVNLLVKSNLLAYVSEAAQGYANYLSQHIYTKPTEVDEKIELLAFVYGNKSINLKYLFELVLPNDTLDADVIDARDYLRGQMEEQNILRDFLKVNKYQQTSPDQLLLDILMQIQELDFMTDIASALYTHALFWHHSHSVDNLGQLLELFNAFNNLRVIPAYNKFMETINQVKDHLKDSLNTDIDIRCTRPRICLKMGLKTLAHCDSIDNTTVGLIQQFLNNYKNGCDANLEIGSLESTTPIGLIEEKSSTLASAAAESSTLATSSVTSTLELSATSPLASSRSTLVSVISTLATSTSESLTTGMIIESSGTQNNSSFPKEMNLVTQENVNNTQESAALGKKDSSIEQINLTSSENGNLTQPEKLKSSESEKTNNATLNNDNSAKDQEDSSCESGEECGDDDTQAIGDQQTSTIAPKNDPSVPGDQKKDDNDSGNEDEGAAGTSSDSVSCKLKGCYEQTDSSADESAASSSSHAPKVDETTPSSDTTTSISVEYYPTHQPSTTTTSTTLRSKKRRKIICHHWNRHQRQKVNKSTAVTEVVTDKKLKSHQKGVNANNEQPFVMKDAEASSSEAKLSMIDDDALSQESLEKVYYQNSEYDDENNEELNENDSLGSKASSKEVKNRLLDINTPKFFNFEIKRDETVSEYNTQKKRDIHSDESLDEDVEDRVLDWNSPKFFNFEIKRDETVIGDMHNNMEMSVDSHDVANTNNNGRPRRHACNQTANASLKKNRSVDESDVASNADVKNRLLDWNAQKFFNFEIKRDESVTTNHSRARRDVDKAVNMTSPAVERTTESLLSTKHENSSVINDDSEAVKNNSNNSSDVGIGKYLGGSGLAKLFNLDVKRKEM
ncbi:uncharacterized protein [Chelonus insularis]|uniref:uncharacterized protein n=1 Tax=Chelonus insularis TaxID=460826 RepID=UPI00158E380A|nr:uncharacterized protein LOC118063744 [Chelonus insularis]